jgi:DNA-binding response OmpR family regulator
MPVVLSVSSLPEDHDALRRILAGSGWTVRDTGTFDSAVDVLQRDSVPIVVCDADTGWYELIEWNRGSEAAPMTIVASRRADGVLWAQALNLGAYDVLAKPFDRREVLHVLEMAWQRWQARDMPAYQPAV